MPKAPGSSEFLSFRLRWSYLFVLVGAAAVYFIGLSLASKQVTKAEDAIRAGKADEASKYLGRVEFLAGKPFLPKKLKARICGLLGDRAVDAGDIETAMGYYKSEMKLLGGGGFVGTIDKSYLQSIAHSGSSTYRAAYERYLQTGPGKEPDWNDSDLIPHQREPDVPDEENAWSTLAAIPVTLNSDFLSLGEASADELAEQSKRIGQLIGEYESKLRSLHAAVNQREAFAVPEDEEAQAQAVDCSTLFKLLRLEAHHRMHSGDRDAAPRALDVAFRMIGFIESRKSFYSLVTALGYRKLLMSDIETLREAGLAEEELLPLINALGARPITMEFARECVKADYAGMKGMVADGMTEAASDAQLIRLEICRTYSEYMREVLKCVENPEREIVRDPYATMVPTVAFLRFARLAHFYGRDDFTKADGERAAKLFVMAIASPVSERIRISPGTTGTVLAEVQQEEANLAASVAARPVKATN